MRSFFLLPFVVFSLFSCTQQVQKIQESTVAPEVFNWEKKYIDLPDVGVEKGTSYLSFYSQIYSLTEHKTHDLTVTISMRNTSDTDTLYIGKADCFGTHGELVRHYFKRPIFLVPMETAEIVIEELEYEGGTGANFLFDWYISEEGTEPIFESIMISTSFQQGLSFVTQGKRIK